MLFRLRLLPITIFVLVLMLSVRVGNIWNEVSRIGPGIDMRPAAAAQEEGGQAAQPDPVPTDAAATAEPSVEAAAPSEQVAEKTEDSGTLRDVEQMSPSEIRLLQDLAGRRKLLDARARDLEQREALLKAAEQRLVEQQGNLEQIREEIRSLLDQKEGEEKERMNRLVTIYSNMKPKDAARIFNELDMTVLIDVARNMKERKVAPIVAAMEAEKARQLTRELAERQNEVSAVPK